MAEESGPVLAIPRAQGGIMNHYYLLEAHSGLPNWYGCPRSRMQKIFTKNLNFAERTFGVKCLKRRLRNSSIELILEAPNAVIEDFKRFLIAKMNHDIQCGSAGINIFSGGVDLRELPSYVAGHASDLRSHPQSAVDEVHHSRSNRGREPFH